MRVLIVEDERFLAEAIQSGLRYEAIASDIALDGDTALERIAVNQYDVVVLDRDIPGASGDEVCAIVSRDYPAMRVIRSGASNSGQTTISPSRSRSRSSLSACGRLPDVQSQPFRRFSNSRIFVLIRFDTRLIVMGTI